MSIIDKQTETNNNLGTKKSSIKIKVILIPLLKAIIKKKNNKMK